jgi:hypothetical protein
MASPLTLPCSAACDSVNCLIYAQRDLRKVCPSAQNSVKPLKNMNNIDFPVAMAIEEASLVSTVLSRADSHKTLCGARGASRAAEKSASGSNFIHGVTLRLHSRNNG